MRMSGWSRPPTLPPLGVASIGSLDPLGQRGGRGSGDADAVGERLPDRGAGEQKQLLLLRVEQPRVVVNWDRHFSLWPTQSRSDGGLGQMLVTDRPGCGKPAD
jgi:hypothetical protein